jgi:asparagine N-glycosylation enzyme membrane subunit Stt3
VSQLSTVFNGKAFSHDIYFASYVLTLTLLCFLYFLRYWSDLLFLDGCAHLVLGLGMKITYHVVSIQHDLPPIHNVDPLIF